MTSTLTAGQARDILCRVAVAMFPYFPKERFALFQSVLHAINAGEPVVATEDVVYTVAASGRPVYPWDLADLEAVWGHYMRSSGKEFPQIPLCAQGQSPWGNGVVSNPPHRP